jgi:hypothetical protein
MRIGLLAVLAGGLTAGPASATDQDVFNKFIGKVAVSPSSPFTSFKPRVACVCLTASPDFERPGFLIYNGSMVRCALPGFGVDGTLLFFSDCDTYAVVGP